MKKLIRSVFQKIPSSLVIVTLIFGCTIEEEKQVWQKGNLHTHSFWSDGNDFPEMVIGWYKDHDYQFIALSDHNTIADENRWYSLTKQDLDNKVLEKYKTAFGSWVESKSDTTSTRVRLKTYDEYSGLLEDPEKFLIIRSEEVTASWEKNPIHINVTNIQEKIQPAQGNSVVEVMQKTLDRVYEQRERLAIPMFAHINHPNFGYGISTDDFKKLNGERFFEVYNGHPAVNNEGNETHVSTEIMWDLINIHYLNQNKPLLFGIATDDSHHYHKFSADRSNAGRGWVMVKSEKLSPAGFITAMENGDFYASTGVTLKKIEQTQNKLTIVVDPEVGIDYEIIFLGYQSGGDDVKELARTMGVKATYTFGKEDLFIRAKIISNAPKDSPPNTKETKQAWTQPILIRP